MARLLHQWEQTPSRPVAGLHGSACIFANAGAATLKAHKPFFCAVRRYDPLTVASTNQTSARYNCSFPSGCANRSAEGMHFYALYTPCAVAATALYYYCYQARIYKGTDAAGKSNGTCLRGTMRLYIPRANWSRRRRSNWPLRCLDCFGTSYKC